MKFYFIYILLFLSLYGILNAQDDRVVAEVGPVKIYESEFRDRFDFSAHPKLLQKSDRLKVKKEFLKQLIAEKLLSLDAREKGYDTTGSFKKIMDPLRDMFVRDALYKKEIKNKVSYNPDKINKGIARIRRMLTVNFIFSDNIEEIEDLYNKLKRGASFDSLLSSRVERKDNPKKITFGSMDEAIEDSLYNLKEGQFTSPIYSGNGYYILKLVSNDYNTELTDRESLYDKVEKIVQTRAEYSRYLDYYHSFMRGFRITADKETFEKLVKIFIPALHKKYREQNTGDSMSAESHQSIKYYLKGDEMLSALDKLDNATNNKPFINIEENPVKPGPFIFQLSQDGFIVRDLREMSIRSSLSSYIRKFIEDKLLAREGYKEGLENSREIKKDLGMWEDSYLSKLEMINMFDSVRVSEEQAYSIYQQNDWKDTMPPLVDIAEVLTDSLSIAETVLNELSKGVSIKELARRYTKRDSLRSKGGEFGYFRITQHGEIGRIASRLKTGDVYGPLKLDEGYSIFQVIDKKEDTTSYRKSFAEVKNDLIAKITLAKFEKYINKYNARLAGKYGVEIYDNVLNSIDNIFMNLVVARYMGFGGEIYAVPYTEQYSGWYDIWIKNKSIVQ